MTFKDVINFYLVTPAVIDYQCFTCFFDTNLKHVSKSMRVPFYWK